MFEFDDHHVIVGAWPISGSPNLSGSGTAQPPACWAQKFSKRRAHNTHNLTRKTDPATRTSLAEKFCDP
jgi:hypothetical protein|tara:strand:- start:1549 stop:1755 length:207 start_codon:yes stop_codon:yes gene_type:complete